MGCGELGGELVLLPVLLLGAARAGVGAGDGVGPSGFIISR